MIKGRSERNSDDMSSLPFFYRWRFGIIFTLLVVALSAGSGGRLIEFSTDYRVFFSEENPQLNAFEALQNTYTKNDNVMIALSPKDGEIFTKETLAVLQEITLWSWQIPYSIRVDSITNFQHTHAEEDDLIVEDLILDLDALGSEELLEKKKIALAEPLLVKRLINPESTMSAVNVTINLPGLSNEETTEVVQFVRKQVGEYKIKYPELDFYMTGVVYMNNAFNEAGQGDMKTLIPIMYILVFGTLWLVLRSLSAVFVSLIVIALSMMTAMGLAGWIGILLTPISANAPTIILTLGVADSIHLLTTFLHEMRTGRTKIQAMAESVRINHQPVFITSITTAIGFLSLNFSDSPPFRDLGNIVAIGVMAAYLYSIVLLPALISLLPVTVKQRSASSRNVMDGLADFVIAHRTRLFWGVGLIIVILVSLIPRIEIDESFDEYFDERYEFRRDNDYVIDHLTGFETIEYSLSSGEKEGFNDPAFLKTVQNFANWYRGQKGVLYVNTITDTMKRLNKNMHGDDQSFYTLPDSRELAAQYLLLYELSLPFGLDVNNQINVNKSSTRLVAVVDHMSTKEALTLEDRAQLWLQENAPPEMKTPGASPLIMFSHIAKRNIESMMLGTALALALISFVLALALKSPRFGLISLIPNIAPVAMTFGIWAIIFTEVGLSVSVVAPVALGIIVDDTVHFLTKYLRARRERKASPEEAVRYSFQTVGTALWVTSFVLVIGFLVLTFSGFTMNTHLGIMTAIGIVMALMADFLFLPALLMRLEGKKDPVS